MQSWTRPSLKRKPMEGQTLNYHKEGRLGSEFMSMEQEVEKAWAVNHTKER
jgi:hypothetical protein